jgi:N-acetylglutamate synthase/N-acetylornithine aminotransferase
MRGAHVHIRVDVGVQVKSKNKASKNKASKNKAKGQARIWASDLTHGYIDINADYRS